MGASNFFRTGADKAATGYPAGSNPRRERPPAEGFKWVKAYFLIEAFQK
ncbi:hypothetical protein [Ensifer adhaerens]|nr:hypothetical protein [Ensifer adhaerens]